MRLMELERRKLGKPQLEIGEIAGVDPSYICRAERHGMAYDKHLERIAVALGWKRNPKELLEEVR